MVHTPSTITEKVYSKLIRTLEQGYYDGKDRKPNPKAALALRIMHDTGLSTAQVTQISFAELTKLDLASGTASAAMQYYRNTDVTRDLPLIGGSSYAIQRMVKFAADYLGYNGLTPDSVRQMHTPAQKPHDPRKTERFSYTK